ncbi:MAG: MFS transporter [Leptospiraceae bacterium]|nr:MFS transporter [Leptospiraceae bacterium]MDW7975688.1 MFS transporter [Leptospiraceae bacterium]
MAKFNYILLGFAELGFFFVEIIIRLYLLKYYTDEIKLDPKLAGIAISISLLWDAISDPLMGYISDHFPLVIRTKNQVWKKKRVFYMILGSLFTSLFFIVLFLDFIKERSQVEKFFYLLVNYFFLNTFLTIMSVPHSALCSEASINPNDRNWIFGFRLIWGNIGLILGILLPTYFSLNQEGVIKNILFAAVILISVWVSSLVGFQLDTHEKTFTPKSYFFDVFRTTKFLLKNQYLFVLVLSYFIAFVGIGINSAIALFYYEYTLKFSEQETSLILLVFLLVWTFSVPVWIWLAKRFEKKHLILLAIFSLGLGTVLGYPNFPERDLIYPLIASVVGGILAASIVLMDTLIADLTNYDFVKLRFREKRDGLFFGFLKMIIKVSRAVSILISSFALGFIGFHENPLSFEVSRNISYIFGYGVGFFLILSSLVFLSFDYDSKKHEKVIRIIQTYQKLKEAPQNLSKSIV